MSEPGLGSYQRTATRETLGKASLSSASRFPLFARLANHENNADHRQHLRDLAVNYWRAADALAPPPPAEVNLKLTDQHKQQIMDAVLRNAKVQE
jgi:hypothetical protein